MVIIFDLDGTLIDSTEVHAETFVKALADLGINVEKEKVRKLVGKSAREISETFGGKQWRKVLELKTKYYLEEIENLREIEGASRVIHELRKRGIKIGLATSGSRIMTDAVLRKFKWRFDFVITYEDVKFGKPHPEMLAKVLEVLGGPAIYVGDTVYDEKMGKWCGVKTLILGKDIQKLEEVLDYRLQGVKTHKLASREVVGVPANIERDYASAVLLTKDLMKVNEEGLVHGSFTFGVADLAAMLSVNEPGVLLKSATAEFLQKVFVGDVIVAEARREGDTVMVEARVKDKKVFDGVFEMVI